MNAISYLKKYPSIVHIHREFHRNVNLLKTILHRIKSKTTYNKVDFQRKHWEKFVTSTYKDENKDSYWGDLNSDNHKLGNYVWIKDYLHKHSNGKRIIDLGSLYGKWTPHFKDSKEVICLDLQKSGFDVIKKNNPDKNIRFIQTPGDSIPNIDDSSVNFIFSMDTLVRTDKKIIFSYLDEIYRVLEPNGTSLIHLPINEIKMCIQKGFASINLHEIVDKCNNLGFSKVNPISDIINHGILLELIK
jgi:SAM-dependent methyltransferase